MFLVQIVGNSAWNKHAPHSNDYLHGIALRNWTLIHVYQIPLVYYSVVVWHKCEYCYYFLHMKDDNKRMEIYILLKYLHEQHNEWGNLLWFDVNWCTLSKGCFPFLDFTNGNNKIFTKTFKSSVYFVSELKQICEYSFIHKKSN